MQVSFSYSDGFGREIQKKVQAEPGPVIDGGPVANRRWVGSGWTIFNNKGKPVRQYEPFFSDTHRFESTSARRRQPGPVLRPGRARGRDAAPQPHLGEGRLRPVAQTTWDVNDTVLIADPSTDPDVGALFAPSPRRLPAHVVRGTPGRRLGAAELAAAAKAAAHAATPTTAFADAWGRPFLTIAAQPIRPRRSADRREPDDAGDARHRGQSA